MKKQNNNQLNSLVPQLKIVNHPAREEFSILPDRLIVPLAEGIRLLPIDKIVYLHSCSNYTRIHMANGSQILASKTMKHFIHQLPKNKFVRIHRSYFVSTAHISMIYNKGNASIELFSGKQIPVSRSGKTVLNSLLDKV